MNFIIHVPKGFQLMLFIVFWSVGAYAQIDAKIAVDSSQVRAKGDTLVANFVESLKEDLAVKNPLESFEESLKANKPLDKDTIKHKFIQKIRKIDLSGEISIGYDYGLLTGYIDTSSSRPLNVLRSEANLGVTTLGLPLNVSYNYSTFQNPLGVNNYFRISLDTEKLKAKAGEKKNEVTGELDSKIGEVQNSKAKLSGKMGYGEVLMQKLSKEIDKGEKELNARSSELTAYQNKLNDQTQLDSSALASQGGNLVGERTDNSKKDSLQKKYDEANEKYQNALALYDTVNKVYSKARDLYDTYSNIEEQLSDKKALVDGYSSLYSKDGLEDGLKESAGDSLSDRKEGLLGSIKTFDLGLTYPQTTALSKNSAPIKGINIEVQRKKWYTAVSAGVTLNNLMVSADAVENKLSNTQNLFNQFDFQNIKQKGFLVNVVSGYGTKEGAHALLGVRYLSKSKFTFEDVGDVDSVFIPSLGLELDLRFMPKFLPKTILDFVYGKTSDSKKLLDGTRSDPINSLFSSDRTHTSLIRLTQPLEKIRSEITASVRWIDPNADVRSLGVLQPNNMRYEVRTHHSITSRLKCGLNFRKDRNNVDNALDSTIRLDVIGGQFNGQIGKIINYFGSVNYLTQSVSRGTETSSRTNNYMFGAGITAQYSIADIQNGITFSYNDYLITDSISTGLFRNIGIQNMTRLKNGQNTFSVSYFGSEMEETEKETAYIVGDEFTIQKEKVRLTLGIKMAFSENNKRDAGGKVEVLARVTKFLEWSLKAEKLVLGDFYATYDRDRFNRFPYVLSTNLNFIIK